MCGIIYVKKAAGHAAHKMVAKRYSWQKLRGQKGFGFVSINSGQFEDWWRAEDEARILKELANMKGNEIIFHHRNPTSTPNFWEAAHPIFVSNKCLKYDYYFVHNGVIQNADTLKEAHDKLGFEYQSQMSSVWVTKTREQLIEEKFNDSEALAIEFALDMEGGQKGIAHVKGRIAFIALRVEKISNKPVSLYYGHNAGSPLVYLKTDESVSITSEGGGDEIPTNNLFRFDYADKTTTQETYRIGEYTEPPAARNTDWYNQREYNRETKTWELKKTPMGFTPPAVQTPYSTLLDRKIEEAKKTDLERKNDILDQSDHDIARYMELAAEKEKLEKALQGYEDMTETAEDSVLNRLKIITQEMNELNAKHSV